MIVAYIILGIAFKLSRIISQIWLSSGHMRFFYALFLSISENIDTNHLLWKSRVCFFCKNVGLISTKFGEIMQNNGHYGVQGHSMSPISVQIGSRTLLFMCQIIVTYILYCTVSDMWWIIRPIFAIDRGMLLFNAYIISKLLHSSQVIFHLLERSL